MIGMPDIQAIDFCDSDVLHPLIVQDSLTEILPCLQRIAVVAPAIATPFLGKLHRHIEVVRFAILAQDKAAAVRKQDDSPDDIRWIRFCISLLQNKKAHRSLMVVKLRWADKWTLLL